MKSSRIIIIVGLSFLGVLGCSKMQPGMPIHQSADTQDERDYCMTKSEDPRQDSLSQSNPTHKILRIYIDTPEQLQAIERDTSVMIFHYCSPSDSESYSPVHYSPSEKGYTYVCDANEAPAIDLYPIDVYWPIGKRIPRDYRYHGSGNIVIPSFSTSDEDDRGVQPLYVNGQVRAYDNRLNQYMPIAHARLQYYSMVAGVLTLRYSATDSLGYFSLYKPAIISEITLQLENSHFTIRENNTSPIKSYVLDLVGSNPGFKQFDLASDFYLDVFKAASYYFYESNSVLSQITKYSSMSSMSIFAVNNPDPINNNLGVFSYGGASPYITIYNAYSSDYSGAASKVYGTVLHELGHATHYMTDGYAGLYSTETVVKESFASFFGWYNVMEYYSAVAPNHSTVHSICTQGRQSWTPLSTNLNYTPFYIDLYDDYNQNLYYLNANVDTVSSVPVSALLNMSFGHTTFQSVYNELSTYIGQYFTASEFNTFTSPYSIFL